MTKNPLCNALFAIAYIIMLVSVVFTGPHLLNAPQQSIFYPMLALSVLVLSVALMAYLFFYQPVLMLLDGKRDEGVNLFLHTVGIFAFSIAVLLSLAISVHF